MTALLKTDGLTMAFGGVRALNNVDFAIARGELRCVIGPNGAGKSTFFKCITGQLRPVSGRIEVDGASIVGLEMHQIARRGIGIKMQVPQLFEGLDVAENVWLAARHALGRARAEAAARDVIERIGIGDVTQSIVGHLAHGQRQLVEFAMVLAGEPKLVLLDEPAAGMTDDETGRMTEVIREINRTAAVIVIEHDMQFIRSIAETITVFHQGAILMEDKAEVVLSDQTVREVYLGKQGSRTDA